MSPMRRFGGAMVRAAAMAALMGSLMGAASEAQTPGQAKGVAVLSDTSPLRFFVMFQPPEGTVVPRNKTRWVRWGEEFTSVAPPADWASADFDDGFWPRRVGSLYGGYGYDRNRGGAGLICARARFGVNDPAAVKDLQLTVTVRGGAVVYLNGKEIGRAHMPKGDVSPTTAAEAYSREDTMNGDDPLPPVDGRATPKPDLADAYKRRFRTLRVSLPAEALRKGSNVVAVEVHRANLPREAAAARETWDPCGLCGMSLTTTTPGAVQANVAPPAGRQVWAADPLLRTGVETQYADALEPQRPARLEAPANGFASAQVVVADPEGLKQRFLATVSDLKGAAGATIPASAVRVRYAAANDRGFTPLYDAPEPALAPRPAPQPEGKKAAAATPAPLVAPTNVPVWLTVHVPANAAPGTYTGTLTLEGLDRTLPVELTVYGWKAPNPYDYRQSVNLLQSPESVAGHYKVALWSDQHFALMEKTFALMGELGNDVLGVSAVGKNVFGDDPLVLFHRENGKVTPELKHLERYLTLYGKHAGAPKFLSVHIWSYGMYFRGFGRDGGSKEERAKTIPLVELQGDKLVGFDYPMYGEPGTEDLWKQVMDGVQGITRKLGWSDTQILMGSSGDTWPDARTVDLFKKVAPYAKWRALTHGNGVPKWGESDEERTQPNHMVVGYLEMAREITNSRVVAPGVPIVCNARDSVGVDPFQYIQLTVLNASSRQYDGICWKGLDYWPYTPAGETQPRSALKHYAPFGNMVGGTPRTLAAPGPAGAVATQQFEALREGLQEVEAFNYVSRVLNHPPLKAKLPAELAAKCDALITEVPDTAETGYRGGPHGGTDWHRQAQRIYQLASEVAKATGGAELPKQVGPVRFVESRHGGQANQ